MHRIDVGQALIARDDGRVLPVRSRVHPHGLSGWGFPGGRREPGETLAECAARETLEETGLVVEIGQLLALGEWLHRSHDLFAVFEARIVSGEPAVQEKEEVVVELEWVDPEEAGRRMPWYPGGVRGLLEGEPVYYTDRGDQPSTE